MSYLVFINVNTPLNRCLFTRAMSQDEKTLILIGIVINIIYATLTIFTLQRTSVENEYSNLVSFNQ